MKELELLSKEIDKLSEHIDTAYVYYSKKYKPSNSYNVDKFIGLYRFYNRSNLKNYREMRVDINEEKLFLIDIHLERLRWINSNQSMNAESLVIDITRLHEVIKEIYFK